MNRVQIETLLAEYEPRLLRDFLDAISRVRDSVVLRRLEEAIAAGDINRAVAVVGIDAADFNLLRVHSLELYYQAGDLEAAGIKAIDDAGQRIIQRFGARNMGAEAVAMTNAATRIENITEETRQAVRESIGNGLARGQNPNKVALDIVGRRNRVTGRREGGILGMSAPQASYVDLARANLLSGDPARMKKYFDLTRRWKRGDGAVLRAIAKGKPLNVADVDKLMGRLSDSYIKLRGELLARHETMSSMGAARDDAMAKSIADGNVDIRDAEKTWMDTGDDKVRKTHSHADLGGKTIPFDEAFVTSTGHHLMYPHDPDADLSEIMGCRCWIDYRINYVRLAARRAGRG